MARVRIIRQTRATKYAQGIHLYKPSKFQIQDAKDQAYNQGFTRIYVSGLKRRRKRKSTRWVHRIE